MNAHQGTTADTTIRPIAPQNPQGWLAAGIRSKFMPKMAPITDGGNSTTVAVPSSTVSQKALTVTGATASNRVYDGTTSIAVSGGSLVGVVGGDEVDPVIEQSL